LLKWSRPDIGAGAEKIANWRHRYPICPDSYHREQDTNPYVFTKRLSFCCNSNSVVCVGTGCSVAWLMQAFEVKEGQRVLDHCNNMAMGWSIPGGIASCFASPTSEVICVIGDGSLMMTTHELETIAKHNLPTKSLVSDNVGHSTIRQTLDQWFASDYFASPPEGGLP
jgi:acetolactate synthase I/II/III large subunit